MSDPEFENYVALIGKLLQLKRDQCELIAGELEDHLQLRVADLTADGLSKQEATRIALEEFGDAAVMANNFQLIHNLKRRRNFMRFATFSIAGTFLVAILTMAMWPSDSRFGSPSKSLAQETQNQDGQAVATIRIPEGMSASSLRDLEAEKKLTQKISVSFVDTPFEEVVDYLRDETRLNMILTNSCRDDSLTEDEPLTFAINEVPLNKTLELMLAEKNATYCIDDGVITFISLDEALNPDRLRVKMFDVADILDVMSDQIVAVGGGIQGGGKGRTGMGGGMFAVHPQLGAGPGGGGLGGPNKQGQSSGEAANTPVLRTIDRGEVLLDLIKAMVEPESWLDNGGSCEIRVVNNVVICKQTETGLRKSGNLLEDLRARLLMEGDSFPSPKATIELPETSKPNSSGGGGAGGIEPGQ